MIGIATVGALWKIARESGSMSEQMRSILKEVQLLRIELGKDIEVLEEGLKDHEQRIRTLESEQ